MKKPALALSAFLLATQTLTADDAPAASWWESWKGDLRATWASDDYSVLVPFNIYHIRATYDKEKIKEYNEMPWGAGIERFHIDEHRNRHSLYLLGFADSWSDFQPVLGYSWQKNFYCHDASFGIGYSAMITGRRKNSYVPSPGLVPVASAGYKFLSVQTTWVPYLGHNTGNVFLTMLKMSI
jgi:palmitoyl transferase